MLHNVIGMTFTKDISFSLEGDYTNSLVVASRGQNLHFSTFNCKANRMAEPPCLQVAGASGRT